MQAPIPYSRCGATLPRQKKEPTSRKQQDTAPRKQLFHKFSSISLFEKKKPTAEKWHQQIDQTANGHRPVSEANDAFFLFPWAQLRLHTDEYLRKLKISELDSDNVLCGLISSHEDKVIALAACAHALSPQALNEVLGAFSHSNHTEDYLQAFVAASHGNGQIIPEQDEAWARTLVAVVKSTNQTAPSALALDALYIQFSRFPLPSRATLRSKVPAIVGSFLQHLNTALTNWREKQNWPAAVPVRSILAKIDERAGGGSQDLEQLLQAEAPSWRNWAAWQPDESRLRAWQHLSTDWLRPMWTLLGPNFDYVDGVHLSTLSKVIRDGAFVAWLQTLGITPGPGLSKLTSNDGTTAFACRLFSILDTVCTEKGTAAVFFWHLWLDDTLGVDDHALGLWESARKHLLLNDQASDFLFAVIQGEAVQGNPTWTIAAGLTALDRPECENLRKYLCKDISHLITETVKVLRSKFVSDLSSGNGWYSSGSAIVSLRSTIEGFKWLEDVESADFSLLGLSSIESLRSLEILHQSLQWPDDTLEPAARIYIENIVLGTVPAKDEAVPIIDGLHKLWQLPKYESYRSAALVLSHLKDVAAADRAQCLKDLYVFTEKQVKKLEDALIGLKYKAAEMCHCIVRLAAKAVRKTLYERTSWAALTRYTLETYNISPRYAVADQSLTKCSFKKYKKWVQNLNCVFGDLVENISPAKDWVKWLSPFEGVLDTLQTFPRTEQAMHCIFTSHGAAFDKDIIKALESIEKETRKEPLMLMMLVMLSLTDKSLAKQVSEALLLLSKIPEEGLQQCKRLLELSRKESVYIAAVQMKVWLQDEWISNGTKKAMKHIGAALHLPTSPQAVTAKDYFLERVAAMMKTAHQVEGIRTYLKGTDRVGLATVLTNLGLEDASSYLEEEISGLPNELLNFVEQVDDKTAELQFPLSNVKELQKNAMGLKQNESLVVRLSVNDNGSWESFCVHAIDSETQADAMKHEPLQIWSAEIPSRQTCKLRAHSRVAYVVKRCIWRRVKYLKSAPLADIYRDIELAIRTYGKHCLICDDSIGAQLYKPTICTKVACQSTYLLSDLEVRLADLRLNQKTVGLLLAAVQSATLAMSDGTNSSIDLLPTRPLNISDNYKLIAMLDTIPSLPTFVKSLQDFGYIRTKHSFRYELLFSWALNTHKCFIVEAAGALRIPNMPNVQQFVLVDSPPEITAAFAKHDAIQPRQVLFHGTSMERLFAILCQGLKVLSDTALQVHGAVYGNGIYLAEQPSLAVSYSRASQRRVSSFSTQHADFVNKRVLLGIEYAGEDGKRTNGMYVATDPTKLLLRYIFLLPATFKAPLANHVVPAMQSNFHTLKKGARSGS